MNRPSGVGVVYLIIAAILAFTAFSIWAIPTKLSQIKDELHAIQIELEKSK